MALSVIYVSADEFSNQVGVDDVGISGTINLQNADELYICIIIVQTYWWRDSGVDDIHSMMEMSPTCRRHVAETRKCR